MATRIDVLLLAALRPSLLLVAAIATLGCKSDHAWKGSIEIGSGADRLVMKPGPCGPPSNGAPGSLALYAEGNGSLRLDKSPTGYAVSIQRAQNDFGGILYMNKQSCATFDVEVKPTGQSSHDRTEYGGHVKLVCQAEGRDVKADITFEDCR